MLLNVVAFGGGTGQPMVLRAIKPSLVRITAVTSTADSGGSAGILRDEQGVLPPSDALRCMLALANMDDPRAAQLVRACRHRFAGQGSLVPNGVGHVTGSILFTAFMQLHGRMSGFGVMQQQLAIAYDHRVLPATLADVTLVAELTDGSLVRGETNIDRPASGLARAPIKRVWLEPTDTVTPNAITPLDTPLEVVQAIQRAEVILIPPGDLFTSIVASLLPGGIREAISSSTATIVVCVNTMTKVGETDGCGVARHVEVVEEYLGRKASVVVCNTGRPDSETIARYAREEKLPVEVDIPDDHWDGRKVIKADLLVEGELARHDPGLLGHVLHYIFTDVMHGGFQRTAADVVASVAAQ